jgi:hypothetical protein
VRIFADPGPVAQCGAVVEQDVHSRDRRLTGRRTGHNPGGAEAEVLLCQYVDSIFVVC